LKTAPHQVKNVVGLIPAAGKASRLGILPFSKELIPVGFDQKEASYFPKIVSSYLLDQMTEAGISSVHLVLRKGKWDIPNYFGGGKNYNNNICYHIADYEYCVPFTIDQAYPFIKDKIVAFGFPDILIKPGNVFNPLLEKLISNAETDLVLGMFPEAGPLLNDKVDIAGDKIKLHNIKSIKARQSNFTWIVAVWKPKFSKYLNNYLSELIHLQDDLLENDCQLSDIIFSAIEKGIKTEFVFFEKGEYLDIGTPEGLTQAGLFFRSELSMRLNFKDHFPY